jgi:hypothetical protein
MTVPPGRSIRLALLLAALAGCDNDEVTPPEEPELRLTYLGSENCAYCHSEIFNEFRKSGHPYKLQKIEDGQPPTFPYSQVPSPPAGFSWNDITYVIGGFGWKARFIGTDGYIITQGGMNQYNLATGQWVDYEKDNRKPYDCGPCHTTGYRPDGHEDDLQGIVGQWEFPGIQCEECHGAGSLHAQSPQTIRMTIDTRAEACGQCHNRGGVNDVIPAKGGFIEHHEQYNELQSSGMRLLECVTCHDPHTGVRYNDQEGAAAIRVTCEECHTEARRSLQTAGLASFKGDARCEDCHMPYATKSAVASGPYVGDVRTHIFRINADSLAEPFNGSVANPNLTLEYVCLGCHPGETKGWAAANAQNVHGPDFASRRGPARLPRLTVSGQ